MKRFSFQPRYCQGRDSWIIDLFHDPESWAEHLATLQAMLLCVTLSSNKLWKSWQLGVNSSSLVAWNSRSFFRRCSYSFDTRISRNWSGQPVVWNSRSFSGDFLILLIPGISRNWSGHPVAWNSRSFSGDFLILSFPGIEMVTLMSLLVIQDESVENNNSWYV